MAWEYIVFCFQRRMKSASNGWSGTGPFDALLFGKPTWPQVQVRRTWIIASAGAVENRSPSSKPETNLFTFGKTGAPGEALLGLDEVIVGAKGAHRLQAPV